MKLFGSKKEKKPGCCTCSTEGFQKAGISCNEIGIKVLGSGCAKCTALEKAVRRALDELGMDREVEHITDFEVIASYGVMSTPALVVDGNVVSYGKVLSVEEVKEILQKG